MKRVEAEQLLMRCEAELSRGAPRQVGLQLLCSLLHRSVPYYNWVGVYIAVPEERLLVLGPYEGAPTEHLRIPYGRGICGQAAERLETFLIADVTAESNYLACSIRVKSEIVVPVFRDGTFVAELDIDSHERNAFDSGDRIFLERLTTLLGPHIPEIPEQ